MTKSSLGGKGFCFTQPDHSLSLTEVKEGGQAGRKLEAETETVEECFLLACPALLAQLPLLSTPGSPTNGWHCPQCDRCKQSSIKTMQLQPTAYSPQADLREAILLPTTTTKAPSSQLCEIDKNNKIAQPSWVQPFCWQCFKSSKRPHNSCKIIIQLFLR